MRHALLERMRPVSVRFDLDSNRDMVVDNERDEQDKGRRSGLYGSGTTGWTSHVRIAITSERRVRNNETRSRRQKGRTRRDEVS